MWTASEKQDLAKWSDGEGRIKQNRQREATERERKNIVCDETYKQFRGTESSKEGDAKQEERSQFMEGFVSENLSFIWRAVGRSEAKLEQRGRYWSYGRREWMTECADEDGKEWESRAQMEGLPLQEILPLLDFVLLQKIY